MVDIYDAEIRNQVLLEGVKNSKSNDFVSILRDIERFIRVRLSDEGDSIETKRALNSLLSDIYDYQKTVYDGYTDELIGFLADVGVDQASFEVEALENYVINADIEPPANDVVYSALRNNIMSIENYSGKPLMESFIRDYTGKQVQRIQTTIQQGYAQGRTVSQITRDIRGTKRLNYADGDMAKVERSNRAMVHTAIQHASTQGRKSTWKKNSDIISRYEWVSTLDRRTTNICRSLDGQTWEVDKGPLPPIHPNCRSTTVPVVDRRYSLFPSDENKRPSVVNGKVKRVDASQSYYDWLKNQPVKFQNQVIGPTRGKLLRDGGISSDQFAKLNLNNSFEPMTLGEMRELRPDVFERAGI